MKDGVVEVFLSEHQQEVARERAELKGWSIDTEIRDIVVNELTRAGRTKVLVESALLNLTTAERKAIKEYFIEGGE